jgi:hypothetical protein
MTRRVFLSCVLVTCLAAVGLAVSAWTRPSPRPGSIYYRIKAGMTQDEVDGHLGMQGIASRKITGHLTYWDIHEDGLCVRITFQRDKTEEWRVILKDWHALPDSAQ